jgi:tyrosine-protein phosphatase SIW14
MLTSVDQNLWRGSRPEPNEFAEIRARFSAVLSLEGTAEDEKEAIELRPSELISCPISFLQIYFTGITQEALAHILEVIRLAPKPLLVHCEHGQDRTGLVVAAYRVTVCGWTKQWAMNEALEYGYRNWLNFGLNKTWNSFV